MCHILFINIRTIVSRIMICQTLMAKALCTPVLNWILKTEFWWIKKARRSSNNFRYVDDTILKAESEEELRGLLMRVKEENEKTGLKLSIQKLRSWNPVRSFHGKLKKKKWKQWHFTFLGSKITMDSDCSHEIKRWLLLGKKTMTNLAY